MDAKKDTDARWTRKYGTRHYGYTNHMTVDRRHKLVRRCHLYGAALHTSQAADHLRMHDTTASDVWADAAYRSGEMEGRLRARTRKSRIHRTGKRGKPLG